jgi:hypothetical protein
MHEMYVCFAAPEYRNFIQELQQGGGARVLLIDATFRTMPYHIPLYTVLAIDPVTRRGLPIMHAMQCDIQGEITLPSGGELRVEAASNAARAALCPNPHLSTCTSVLPAEGDVAAPSNSLRLLEDALPLPPSFATNRKDGEKHTSIVNMMLDCVGSLGLLHWNVLLMDHDAHQWKAAAAQLMRELTHFFYEEVVPLCNRVVAVLPSVSISAGSIRLANILLRSSHAFPSYDTELSPATTLREVALLLFSDEFVTEAVRTVVDPAHGVTLLVAALAILTYDIRRLGLVVDADPIPPLGETFTWMDDVINRWQRVARAGGVLAQLLSQHLSRRIWLCQFHVLTDWTKYLRPKCGDLRNALQKQNTPHGARANTALYELTEMFGRDERGTSDDNLWCYVYLKLHGCMYCKTRQQFDAEWASLESLEPLWVVAFEYLRRHYFNPKMTPLWALHCRKHEHYNENTTGKLESMHNYMKNVYLDSFRAKDPLRVIKRTVGSPSSLAIRMASMAYNIYMSWRSHMYGPSTTASAKRAIKVVEQAAWCYAYISAGQSDSRVTVPSGASGTNQQLVLHFDGMSIFRWLFKATLGRKARRRPQPRKGGFIHIFRIYRAKSSRVKYSLAAGGELVE